MFKKLKDKLEEEFKQGPLKFPVSVQQLAQVISPSPSLNSLSDNNPSSSVTYTSDPSNVSTDFFSIGDDDDSQDGSSKTLPLHSIDLTATSPTSMPQNRSRRSSLSSVTSEASSLFPIYEIPSGQNYFQSDLESEMEDGMPSQIEKISKEQLYQSYKKIFNRYNKYKGRYVDLHRHYKELLHDNVKTKNVLQESQDKALRRIAELKEQCQLEQNAKAHLEESLRNDVEDRDHMITTLKTKISLLRGNGGSDGLLIDIDDKSNVRENENVMNELDKLKQENESLRKEISDLKKIKETACHLIHRCDTTIEEATEDVNNENLKRKMSELKSEIQKMKSENESLSHLLSSNIIIEDDKKSQSSIDGNILIDLASMDSSQGNSKSDEKDKKIEKLNNLLLKCKEKISSLNNEIKSKNLVIEDKNKKNKELSDELELNKKSVSILTGEVKALKMREEENALIVAKNKMAIHKELETKEEQIRALTKELKTSENEFQKEKDDLISKYEDKLKEMSEDLSREDKCINENNKILDENVLRVNEVEAESEKVKEWESEYKKMLDIVKNEHYYESFISAKSAEIDRASSKVEERMSKLQRTVIDLIAKQKQLQHDHNQLEGVIRNKDKTIEEMRSSIKAENRNVEKLNSENANFAKKIKELELELVNSKEMMEDEKRKMLEERMALEKEVMELKEKMEGVKKDCLSAVEENKRLNEELKSAEGENCLIEKINNEKTEAEKKLRDYIENYKKLEKENQLLESNLSKKCDKLLKDLNDSKEKIKALENEIAAKTGEIESLKSSLADTVGNTKKMESEIEDNRVKLKLFEVDRENLTKTNEEMCVKFDKISKELNSTRKEHCDIIKEKSMMEEENKRLKDELKLVEERVKDASEENIKIGDDLKSKLESLEIVKDELSCQLKNLEESLENEKKINAELADKVQKNTTEKSLLEKEIESLRSKCQGLEDECLEKRKEEELLSKENENLKERLSVKVKELTDIANNKSELTEENNKLKIDILESEKKRSDISERVKVIMEEKNEIYDLLQMKVNELETLKGSLNSAKEELAMKMAALEEEKQRLTSENENKLNVLKNEIKFMNNKFEEDIGNMEENRSMEVSELTSRLITAEKTSSEILEKLEKITMERDEAKATIEERNIKLAELEHCLSSIRTEMDQKFNGGKGEDLVGMQQEMSQMITKYESELRKMEEENHSLQSLVVEYKELLKTINPTGERLSDLENQKTIGNKIDADKDVEVEEIIKKENGQLSNTVKEQESETESESVESIKKKFIQQSAEIKELKKQYKREVTELRKIISMKRKSRRNSAESPDWGGTLDNDTEHEYLRNILYEYMMGREQLVLAKVLSAIVKFDKQQTRNVLEKEQHRQTLFGQLGIL